VIVCILLCGLLPAQAQAIAGIQPGIRGGIYEDGNDFFLGVDVKGNIAMLHANPNFEWIFVDGANAFTLNLDALLTVFPIPIMDPYLGAGLGVYYVKPDNFDSTNDFAFNLIAGLGFNVVLDPYVQLKYVIGDNNTLVLAAGIRF
jgi:opacity protein-like surface antigen